MGPEIEALIQALNRLPGVGARSARRMALHLIERRDNAMAPLMQTLHRVADTMIVCNTCGNIDSMDPCSHCCDPRRDDAKICVVETVGDLWALDRSGAFRGRFHVLGGVLSAIDGVGPEDLNIYQLLKRVKIGTVQEVIIATNATVDGQTTAHYVADQLRNTGIDLTRLAHGVPVGGELDYMDDGTLDTAMRSRRPL
jgi:recombination protein RecR